MSSSSSSSVISSASGPIVPRSILGSVYTPEPLPVAPSSQSSESTLYTQKLLDQIASLSVKHAELIAGTVEDQRDYQFLKLTGRQPSPLLVGTILSVNKAKPILPTVTKIHLFSGNKVDFPQWKATCEG